MSTHRAPTHLRSAAIAGLAVIASLFAPAGAGAGFACEILSDPIRDVQPFWMPIVTDDEPRAESIDITGVAMATDGTSLFATVRVRDLDAGVGPEIVGATYRVFWDAEERTVVALARRDGSRWTWTWYDSEGASGDVTGTADAAADAVTITLPLTIAGATTARALDDVRAEATEDAAAGAPVSVDYAPNFTGGLRRFALDGGCRTTSGAGVATCEVARASAAHGPVTGPVGVRSISFGANGDNVVAQIAVGDLAERATAATERWEIAWFNPRMYDGREQQLAFAERSGQRVEFGFGIGYDLASTTGSIDPAADVISIVVPRDQLALVDGTRLTQVRASAWQTRAGVWTGGGSLPSGDATTSWVVGTSCSQAEVQMCPIVLDRARDARYAEATEEVPENYAGLDLLAVGAVPGGEHVRLQARVGNLRASDPPGAEVVGWTISWRHGGDRVYAQAERYQEGLVFRFGARDQDGERPAGPTFAGVATTGRLDAARNVVEIDVPRSLLPADGVPLGGFGATAWGLSGRTSASVYLVWDETAPRTYLTGAACMV